MRLMLSRQLFGGPRDAVALFCPIKAGVDF
ncbi:hypothetical protein EMIT0158MI4_230065 [Burkholderia ambifaria]